MPGPGSIAFTGFNVDDPDSIAFVALEDLAAGTVITFNDNEWDGTTFNTGEGVVTLTLTSAVAAGTIVRIENAQATPTASTGTVTRTGSFNLSGSTEVLYAYVGSSSAPTFLAAIANEGFTTANGSLTNTGLVVGSTALDLGAVDAGADIGAYAGPRSGQASFAAYRALINNAANWITQDGSGSQASDVTAPDLPFSNAAFSASVAAGQLSIADASVTEGNAGTTAIVFTISRAGGSDGAVSVDYTVSLPGGAGGAGPSDVSGALAGTIAFAAGETVKTITLDVAGDTAAEADETFTVTLSNPQGGVTLDDAVATGTIVNDDGPLPVPGSFSVGDASVAEGNAGTTPISFTVTRDAGSNVAASVHYDVLLPGGATGASAGDFAPGSLFSGDLAFAANETSKTITLQVAGDTVVEGDETFTVNLSAATNGAGIADAQGLGTIVNEDVAPIPTVSVGDVAIAEGQSGVAYAVFTISLNIPAPSPVTIDYATANGSAAAGSDYLALAGTVSFAAGESTKTVSVPILGDKVLEANETFSLVLSNPTGATLADASGTGTITNDDSLLYHSLDAGAFAENWTDTSRISANDNWSQVKSVIGYLGDIDPDGAATGVDPRTLTGANLGAVDVIANQNTAGSSSGGVGEFQLADPTIGLQGSGTGDAPSIVLYMDSRGRSDVRLTATLRDIDGSGDNAAQPIAVQYRTDPNGGWTNVPGGYFADVTTGGSATQTTALDVTLPAGANNAPTLQIRILTTNAVGSDEWVGVDDIVVSSQAGAPSYSIADAAAIEGTGGTTPISFTVSRAGDVSAAGSVGYSIGFAGGGFSASAADLASPLAGTVSFAAGESVKIVTLSLVGDSLPEADEAFTVTLSGPSSGNLGTASATGTIVNDDGPPPFVAISDVTQAEGDAGTTIFTFTVTRTGGSTAFTVDYATASGTALSGSDFLPASGTLSFAAGETSKTVSVAVIGETAGEHGETFSVQLSNAAGAVIADTAGTGTIVNDDIVAIYQLQGASHSSPFVGEAVRTQGIVTAVDSNGFYLQDPAGDGNAATSDAIFVFTGSAPTVLVGDAITVAGTVTEFAPNSDSLSTTEISGTLTITVQSHGNALPAAVLIGTHGVLPPTSVLDDDGLTSFDPATDGLDFYESMEGMRVTVEAPIAVSNTNGFGETWVVASGGVGATGVNGRGGITIAAGDFNPERIQIDDDSVVFAGFTPNYSQGDRLSDVTGILSYANSSYELIVTAPVTITEDVTLQQEVTSLESDRDHLTVADYNVENLDPGDDQGKFDLLAHNIVYNLSAPDIVGLQEIQDADGAGNGTGNDFSGIVTAQKLIDAIAAAGGPTYLYVEVAPAGSTGGEPNGHIHQGFLYNPDRVSYVAGSAMLIEGAAYVGSRNPLVADFTFNGETVKLINVHFTSRIGSDPLMGANQPPADAGDASRTAQAQGVANYINSQLATNPSLKLGVLGDFNGFYFEDAVGTIEAQGLTDLHRLLPAEERYSYFFDGNAQAIDHIVVSGGLLGGAQFDAVHLNSEFANTASRPTDHDSVIARLYIEHPNEAPANLALDHAAIDENRAAGTLVGTLAASDPDADSLSFSLVDDAGGRFAVDPATGRIVATGALDYEAGQSYAILARATDPEGLFVERSFTIAVGDVNEAPTAQPDAVAVNEDATTANLWNVLLGNDSDPDAGAQLTISAVGTGGTQGHVQFDAASHSLVYVADADAFDYLLPGQTATDSFTYTVTDAGGLTSTATVTVTVTGIADGILVDAGNGNDSVTGTSGEDLLTGGNGNDVLSGLDGHDGLWGGNGNDRLQGGAGNDYLVGDNGNDLLDGGAGRDVLAGGNGNDSLTGGADADLFVVGRGGGNDLVTDFSTSLDWIFLDDGISVKSWKVADVNGDGLKDLSIAFSNGGGSLVLLGVTDFSAVHFADHLPVAPDFP
jgi:predicted extracellular nuclease